MKNVLPFVTFIIPCRNEERLITRCLDSIIFNDYPKDLLEVLVLDGMSTDGTKKILSNYCRVNPFIRVIENKKKYTPHAFNIGIKNAKGDVIMIGGAHADYKSDYISKCIKYLYKYDADDVGGVLKAIPFNNSLKAKSISICLNSFFGVGNSIFRLGDKSPRVVDTVFGGCYRKEVFKKVGLFNENLIRTQDMDFNLRLRKAGGKIIFAPDIVFGYYPSSNYKDFFIHNFIDGIWAIYPLKFSKQLLKIRHYLPLFFVLTLPLSIWLYIPLALIYSFKIAIEENDWKYFPLMPIAFGARHIGYGFGSVVGIIKLIF